MGLMSMFGPKVGTRVRVLNGDMSKDLGLGTFVGRVTVYFVRMPDGSLQSAKNAEEEPTNLPEGATLESTPDNPKIELDTGEVVYGCQVWWKPVKEGEKA